MGGSSLYNGGPINLGEEVSFSYSFGPSGSTFVVNGVTMDTGTQAHTLAGDNLSIVIGASISNSSTSGVTDVRGFFDGDISRVAIYDDQSGSRAAPACFAEGTHVMTPDGPRAVETLRPGDLVHTRDGGPHRVVRVMTQHVAAARLLLQPELRPIKIAKGVLGNLSELSLSRQHCVLMTLQGREVLVRAGHLADFGSGQFRRADGARSARYWHLLLADHHLIQAEGCWAETMRPDSAAAPLDARRSSDGSGKPCRPILSGRAVRKALKAALLDPVLQTEMPA